MPSIIEGYEYDIFISYRQKDNRRDGWVTNFVKALENELETTFKEDISVYFDFNPKTGLRETHDVDDSLSNKIRTLILIPVLSQTYCDPRSFAWQNEFLLFKKMASDDAFGLKITLPSGNVGSRLLPVKIHELDPEDQQLLESEIGQIRSVDFIYESHGVNRPLLPIDTKSDNLNKTVYRDQINKLANAIKEIIYGIKYPNRVSKERIEIAEEENHSTFDRSIAVLPFLCLTSDRSQEFFGDSITENIIIQLASLKELKVISRTSVLKYKNSAQSISEIGNELGVKYILEGSVQIHKNQARITLRFIDAELENHLWVKVFDENLDDIFLIQSKVAEEVTRELELTLHPEEKKSIERKPTSNPEAYEYFLKGRHAFNKWNVKGYRMAEKFFLQALEMDPEYAEAWSYLASCYSGLISWNGDLSIDEGYPKLKEYLDKAWEKGPSGNDYLTKAFAEFFVTKDMEAAEENILKAIELSPNNATCLFTYSYILNMMGRHEEAMEYVFKGKKLDPVSIAGFNFMGVTEYLSGDYEKAINTFTEALEFFPNSLRQIDHLAHVYLIIEDYEKAEEILEKALKTATHRPPSMLGYLAVAKVHLGKKEESEKLVKELIERDLKGEKGSPIPLAQVYNALGEEDKVLAWTEKAYKQRDIHLVWEKVDPLVKPLVSIYSNKSVADFEAAEKFILEKLKNELPGNLTYHTYDHTMDVLESAMKIAEAEGIDEKDIPLLRTAILFHDVGFVNVYNGHEEEGARIVKEILPRFNYSNDQIDLISNMILSTKIPQSPKTDLERIVCDADLDYLGRDDYPQIAENLFQELKDQKLVATREEWDNLQKQFMQQHQYKTEFGKNNREMKKLKNLVSIYEKA